MSTFKGGTFVKSLLAPFRKVVYSKRQEFASKGSRSFPFRVESFFMGGGGWVGVGGGAVIGVGFGRGWWWGSDVQESK